MEPSNASPTKHELARLSLECRLCIRALNTRIEQLSTSAPHELHNDVTASITTIDGPHLHDTLGELQRLCEIAEELALVLYKKRNHTQVHESYTVAALPNIATRNSITHENIETSQGCQMIQQNADLRGENSSTYTFLSAPNQYAPVTGVQFFATREIPFASHVATIPHDEPFPVGVPSAGPSSEATNMRSPMFGIEPLYQFAHCKILIAEDNVINQRIMFKFLGKLGLHNVVVASDGQIAVNKFRESMEAMQPFNFIFMDDQMPALSGTDATRLIREMGYRGPICGLLAHVMLKEKQRVIDAGMTTVLQKPFRLRNIREILDQYLVVDAPELEETMLPEFIDETPLPRRKPVVKSRL